MTETFAASLALTFKTYHLDFFIGKTWFIHLHSLLYIKQAIHIDDAFYEHGMVSDLYQLSLTTMQKVAYLNRNYSLNCVTSFFRSFLFQNRDESKHVLRFSYNGKHLFK